jgi:hypothetical protein
MSRLGRIVRNRDEVVVTVPGKDEDGNPIEESVTVTYRPRLATQAFRAEFARHMLVLLRATQAATAAQDGGDADAAVALMDAPEVDKAADEMARLTLSLIDGWDLEDEDEHGTVVPVPFPRTADEIKAFPAPEAFQLILQGVMGALNPNQRAGATSSAPSETPPPAT